jgi:hypothetical protein
MHGYVDREAAAEDRVTVDQTSAGDPFPPHSVIIEVHVAELKRLFNSIDASPFRDRDLDPNAEEFIVSWAREAPRAAPLGLLVYVDRAAGRPDEAAVLRDAVHEFFSQTARLRAGACANCSASDERASPSDLRFWQLPSRPAMFRRVGWAVAVLPRFCVKEP